MSLSDIASFGKKLLLLTERVDKNAHEIKALRQDLKVLTDFTRKVAYAVKRNQDRAEDKDTILLGQLKAELLQLENRLLASNQARSLTILRTELRDKDTEFTEAFVVGMGFNRSLV